MVFWEINIYVHYNSSFFFSQASTFSQVMDTDSDGSEEKAITALGILNTMETILTVMEEQKEVRQKGI